MRVLQIITAFQLGGAEQVAIDLALWLKRSGQEPIICCIGRSAAAGDVGEWQRRTIAEAGIEAIEIGGGNLRVNMLTGPFRLARLIRKLKPDIVHAHVDHADFVVSAARRLTSFPIVRTIHNTVLWPTHYWPGYISEQGLRDDRVVAVSQDAMQAYRDLRGKYGLAPSPHQIVIVDGVPIPSDKELVRRRAARPASDKRIVAFLGRYDGPKGQKGLDLLLAALQTFTARECEGVEFHVYTTGHANADLAKMIAALDVDCRLLPPISNARARLTDFDLVVMPSRFEGMPLLALETLAAGVPLLGADAPGLRLAMPTDWPLKVAPENPAAIAAALRVFLSGRLDLERMRDQGRAWIEPYSLERFFQRYGDVYDELLSDRSAVSARDRASHVPP